MRQMSLPGLAHGQPDRIGYGSPQQTSAPIASFPLATSTSSNSTTQVSPHNSLGNRISTFFGGHRPEPRASNKRPSTSPGLLSGSSSITRLKNNDKIEKRSLFGRSSNDKSRHISDQGSLRSTYGPLGIKDDDLRPREEYHLARETDSSSSRQKLDILRPSTSTSDSTTASSDIDKDRTVDIFGNNFRSDTTNNGIPQTEPDAIALHLAENGQNNSYHEPRGNSTVSIEPSHVREEFSDIRSDRTHANSDMPLSDNGEKAVTTHVNEWNMWGSPSNVAVLSTYPHLKKDRQAHFSWEVNPSLPDGREMMGFGGDLGKKRLLPPETVGPSTSSPLQHLGSGQDVDENVTMPYILGYEKHVLAL